jgi:hypothetical protein
MKALAEGPELLSFAVDFERPLLHVRSENRPLCSPNSIFLFLFNPAILGEKRRPGSSHFKV